MNLKNYGKDSAFVSAVCCLQCRCSLCQTDAFSVRWGLCIVSTMFDAYLGILLIRE